MQQAVSIDDRQQVRDQQLMSQLKLENNTLREVLHIAVSQGEFYQPNTTEALTQTDSDEDPLAMFDSVNLDSSVITVKELNLTGDSDTKDNDVTSMVIPESGESPESPEKEDSKSGSPEKSDSKESSPESVKENTASPKAAKETTKKTTSVSPKKN